MSCLKQPREKRPSDMCEIIKKNMCCEWSVKRRKDPGKRLPFNTNFSFCSKVAIRWVEN